MGDYLPVKPAIHWSQLAGRLVCGLARWQEEWRLTLKSFMWFTLCVLSLKTHCNECLYGFLLGCPLGRWVLTRRINAFFEQKIDSHDEINIQQHLCLDWFPVSWTFHCWMKNRKHGSVQCLPQYNVNKLPNYWDNRVNSLSTVSTETRVYWSSYNSCFFAFDSSHVANGVSVIIPPGNR